MRRFMAFAVLLSVPALAAAQGAWEPVELADVRLHADFRFRQPDGDLLAEADFDGDAQLDRARLVKNTATGRYAVDVELPGGGWSGRLAEGPISELGAMGVNRVGAGTYRTACGKGLSPNSAPCPRPTVTYGDEGFQLIQYEGSVRYFFWNGGGFDEVWISD